MIMRTTRQVKTPYQVHVHGHLGLCGEPWCNLDVTSKQQVCLRRRLHTNQLRIYADTLIPNFWFGIHTANEISKLATGMNESCVDCTLVCEVVVRVRPWEFFPIMVVYGTCTVRTVYMAHTELPQYASTQYSTMFVTQPSRMIMGVFVCVCFCLFLCVCQQLDDINSKQWCDTWG